MFSNDFSNDRVAECVFDGDFTNQHRAGVLKEGYDTGAETALIKLSCRQPNLIASEVQERTVAIAVDEPAWGQKRVANDWQTKVISVSPTGLRTR